MTENNNPFGRETEGSVDKFFKERQSEVNIANYNERINKMDINEQILKEIKKTNSHLENIYKKLDEITNYFKPKE